MGFVDHLKGSKEFHRIHLGVDAGIGLIAFATLVLGDEFFKFFVAADIYFHAAIAGLAFLAVVVHVLEHRKQKP